MNTVRLDDLCTTFKSDILINKIEKDTGEYPLFGAKGVVTGLNSYQQSKPYISIIKWGAGVGRAELRPAYSSIVATMLGVLPNDDVDIHWLCYLLQSMHLEQYATNAVVPNLYFKDYCNSSISVPGIDEQARVSDLLDKVQRIIDLRKQQLSILDELIKARFVEMFGDPEYNNKGWTIKKLNVLCNVGSSKRIYQEEQTTTGVPFWRISDLVAKMDTGNVESSLYIPESRYEELKAQGLVPEPGDILVTSRGTLGRCYIISPEDRFYFQDGMISWLSHYTEEITPFYIQYLFDMPGFRKQIDSMQAGSTVAYLSIAMLKKLDIMLPSRVMQEEFAAFVAQVDKSKVAVQEALDETLTLFDSLMQEYFG